MLPTALENAKLLTSHVFRLHGIPKTLCVTGVHSSRCGCGRSSARYWEPKSFLRISPSYKQTDWKDQSGAGGDAPCVVLKSVPVGLSTGVGGVRTQLDDILSHGPINLLFFPSLTRFLSPSTMSVAAGVCGEPLEQPSSRPGSKTKQWPTATGLLLHPSLQLRKPGYPLLTRSQRSWLLASMGRSALTLWLILWRLGWNCLLRVITCSISPSWNLSGRVQPCLGHNHTHLQLISLIFGSYLSE